jgi:predicted lipoprotein with Yx(FWY)xxD motif/plastocyanin
MEDLLMRMRPAPTRMVTFLPAVLLVVAACGSAGTQAAGTLAPAAPAQATEAPTAATPEGSASTAGDGSKGYEIDVSTDPGLGPLVVGEGGRTLYLFTKDSGGRSVCTGECAANWPPFTLEGGEEASPGPGVTGSIGTTTRDDGTTQVTYDGAPLYYFAGDTKAGDVNGQGINGVWFVVPPSGSGASPAAGSAAPAPSAVTIADFSFSPGAITVPVGASVTWTNTGQRPHTVTADDGAFGSGTLAPGATYQQTFATAGTYTYHCAIHASMVGTVTVTT